MAVDSRKADLDLWSNDEAAPARAGQNRYRWYKNRLSVLRLLAANRTDAGIRGFQARDGGKVGKSWTLPMRQFHAGADLVITSHGPRIALLFTFALSFNPISRPPF
jgi:hypothetical protein